MSKKRGPTPKRVHRADSTLQLAYDRLYGELGARNREILELRIANASLEQQVASLQHALRIAAAAAVLAGAA